MASTGVILRRDVKAAFLINPPVEGELVYAIDTQEFGYLHDGAATWSDFSVIGRGSLLHTVGNQQELANLYPKIGDFARVTGEAQIYIYIDSWRLLPQINDSIIHGEFTWSSQKIMDIINNIQIDLGSY